MKPKSISLDKINITEAAQPRVTLDDAYTEEITTELQAGSEFPPVVVFQESQEYWLADGFHRYYAHIKSGLSEIKAEIHPGGMREAILYAVGANATHGKRRSNEDKRKAVLTLLQDSAWGTWSDRFIAGKCRVSQPFVGTIRKELTDNGYQFPEKRTTSNGRKMDVTKIGSNPGQSPQPTEASVEEASANVQQEANTTDAPALTGENPGAGLPAEETPEEVESATETGQVEVPDPVVESQSDTPESSNSDAGGLPEDITVPAEVEVKSEEDEATEAASEVASPIDGNEDLSQEHETASPQVDEDIPTLKAKVAELQEALQAKDLEIQAKDRIIEDLEAKIWVLENEIADYKKEIEAYEREELASEQANKDVMMVEEATV